MSNEFYISTDELETKMGPFSVLTIRSFFEGNRFPKGTRVLNGKEWVPILVFLNESTELIESTIQSLALRDAEQWEIALASSRNETCHKFATIGVLIQFFGIPILFLLCLFADGLNIFGYFLYGWHLLGLIGVVLGGLEILIHWKHSNAFKLNTPQGPSTPLVVAYLSIGAGVVPFFLDLYFYHLA